MKGKRRKRRRVRPDVFEIEGRDAWDDHYCIEDMFEELTPDLWKLLREQPAGECTCDPGRPGDGWDDAAWGECDGGDMLPSERFYARRLSGDC